VELSMNVGELFRSSGTHARNDKKKGTYVAKQREKLNQGRPFMWVKCVEKGQNNISFL